MAKVTANDVARYAGVSQSAVSRVFTPGASVSKAMEKRVREAAIELGYRPNILARSLITGSSRTIGVVISYLNNQFYPELLELLSRELRTRGYHPLMFIASNQDDIEEVTAEILDYQVDGVVLASVSMSSGLADRCQAAGIPVVLLNRTVENNAFHSVTTDNRSGGALIAHHLIDNGFKRIAFLAGWEQASTQRERERGFLDAMHKRGVSLHSRGVGNFDFDMTKEAVRQMLQADTRPDAIFFANDHMAFAGIGVIEREFGLRIPEDISVVGFDDVPLAAWPSFELTTVRQPAESMVLETLRLLFDNQQNQEPQHIELAAELIVRRSCPQRSGDTE
ncbi:MAG: LacI family DNA-binding transcriptional regulator [Oceanospirillaceae bacterium]|nr:LacI family DNA-binding transcriptional regulator [Oceanospirillaceae bacterium]